MFNKFYTLSLIFLLMVPLGTLLHESGHYLAAKHFGDKPTLHYASVSTQHAEKIKMLGDSIIHSNSFTDLDKQKLYRRIIELRRESFLITLSGPLFNIGLGSICFLILILFQSNRFIQTLKWWFIFGSFLWSRQIINFATGTIYFLKNGNWRHNSDEIKISLYFNFNPSAFDCIGALLASILLLVVFVKFMNRAERKTFVLAGIIGGGLSTLIWFQLLGPYCLP